MPEPEGPPAKRGPDPAPDRCPKCGGPLEPAEDEPDRACLWCGTFVGAQEPSEPGPPGPQADAERTTPAPETDEFLGMFTAFAEETDRQRAEVHAESPEAPEPSSDEAPQPSSSSPPPPLPVLPAPAEERKALPPGEIPWPPVDAVPPAAAPVAQAIPPPPPVPEPFANTDIARSEPEPARAPGTEVESISVELEAPAPEELEAEPPAEPEPLGELEVFECPKCGTEVAPEAPMCPSCGTRFGKSIPQAPPPPAPGARVRVETAVQAASTARAVRKPGRAPKPSRADRAAFYIGAAQVAFGGSGLILGSFLHDLFRVPFVGSAYSAFGPVNVTSIIFGTILVVAGAVTMAAGSHHGRGRRKAAAPGA